MNTADRELLEQAAKTVGLNAGTEDGSYDDLKWWNPLISVAHAEALKADLGLSEITNRAIVEAAAEIGRRM